MRRQITISAVTLLALSFSSFAENNPPEVGNVTFVQRQDGSKIMDIRYDLVDADNDPCVITVEVSSDGGVTWDVPVRSFYSPSDVGVGILPGMGKHIIWNSAVDIPWSSGSQYRVKVCAADVPEGMVLIPAGEFQMGDTFEEGHWSGLPVHSVYIDSFFMFEHEVTNAEYAEALNWAYSHGRIRIDDGYVFDAQTSTPYCDTTLSSSYSRINWDGSTFSVTTGKDNHPMVRVTWYEYSLSVSGQSACR